MFGNSRQTKTNFSLLVKVDKLEKILIKRIEEGIRNFFESLRLAFTYEDRISGVSKINIFLAGNAKKLAIVSNKFNDYIKREVEKITGSSDNIDNIFVL